MKFDVKIFDADRVLEVTKMWLQEIDHAPKNGTKIPMGAVLLVSQLYEDLRPSLKDNCVYIHIGGANVASVDGTVGKLGPSYAYHPASEKQIKEFLESREDIFKKEDPEYSI